VTVAWELGVPGRYEGRCQLDPTHVGQERAHRWSRGRVGPETLANGVFMCSEHHHLSHRETGASYAAGWMTRTGVDPASVPALICTPLAEDGAFHVLDDGDGLCRLAEDAEVVAAGLDPALTLPVALARLQRTAVPA
jgi:hypothetical protein